MEGVFIETPNQLVQLKINNGEKKIIYTCIIYLLWSLNRKSINHKITLIVVHVIL